MKYKPFKEVKKLNAFLRDRTDFSLEAFGTPRQHPYHRCLRKLQDEVKELIKNPKDQLEWADCFLLLTDAAARYGYSLTDLVKFGKKKLAINKKRTWKKMRNGVYQHV